VRFQRYIVGRPNLLTLEVKLIGKHLNPVMMDMDNEVVQYYFNVDVWCTNDEYPPLLEIDCRLVLPSKPFLFKDLSMMLPEGMWLHRKYDKLLYNSIVSLGENYNTFISSTLYPIDAIDLNEGKDAQVSEDAKQMQEFLESQGAKKKKKKLVTMPLAGASSKKIMQSKEEGSDNSALRRMMIKQQSSDKKKAVGKKGAPEKKPAATPAAPAA
jgi:hypothetical protein